MSGSDPSGRTAPGGCCWTGGRRDAEHGEDSETPLASLGARGFPQLDPDGTGPLAWHKEGESGQCFPGSRWLGQATRCVSSASSRALGPWTSPGASQLFASPGLESPALPTPVPGCCQAEPHESMTLSSHSAPAGLGPTAFGMQFELLT